DTYAKALDWGLVYKTALRLQKVERWAESGFSEKLQIIAADSYYKVGETHFNREDYKSVLAMEKGFREKYFHSQRQTDWLNLLARAAAANSDKGKAVQLFGELIANNPTSPYVPDGLLLRA